MDEVMNECVLLTWAQPCQGPRPPTHEKLATSSSGLSVNLAVHAGVGNSFLLLDV